MLEENHQMGDERGGSNSIVLNSGDGAVQHQTTNDNSANDKKPEGL